MLGGEIFIKRPKKSATRANLFFCIPLFFDILNAFLGLIRVKVCFALVTFVDARDVMQSSGADSDAR